MTGNNEKLQILLEKLEALSKKQDAFSSELKEIRNEIYSLQGLQPSQQDNKSEQVLSGEPIETTETYAPEEFVEPINPEK
ncbi:MAG: hypothetical protein IPL92_18985 [Saprospiraceae bacterium]|nr:hypothetical protein [Candidatus Opimibacter iunctus]